MLVRGAGLAAGGARGKRELRLEVEILTRCVHPNLLQLHGYCAQPPLCLVYPIARGGNLEDRLLRTPDGLRRLALLGCDAPPPLPWQSRVRVLAETLRALTHLHALSPPVLHRDVKPSNILLDERGRARLADVGLAKVADVAAASATHMTTRNVQGTPGYLDPLLTNGLQHSELTDGFAAGITLLMALVGLPATGLDNQCRHMLRHPTRPEKWQAPGVPDATAGEWPPAVAATIAEVVVGLTDQFSEERMPLPDALQQLEAIVEVADEPEPPPTRPVPAADVAGGGGEEPRECMMCLDAPRELRFGCGHACCCRDCFDGLAAAAARKGDEGARCPVCREAVVEALRTKKCQHCCSIGGQLSPAQKACKAEWERMRYAACEANDGCQNPECSERGMAAWVVLQADHGTNRKVHKLSSYFWWSCHGGVEAMREEAKRIEQWICGCCHRLEKTGYAGKINDPATMVKNETDTDEGFAKRKHRAEITFPKYEHVNTAKRAIGRCQYPNCGREVLAGEEHAYDWDHRVESTKRRCRCENDKGEQKGKCHGCVDKLFGRAGGVSGLAHNAAKATAFGPNVRRMLDAEMGAKCDLLCHNCHTSRKPKGRGRWDA